ncbi:MAG: SDR family oxidoreductase [Dehalococcoidia bacterium]
MKPATIIFRQQRSGRIITFTSASGLEGNPGQPNYAAKEGIVGLTRSTATAMASYNVTCNAIASWRCHAHDEQRAGTAPAAGGGGSSGPEGIGEVAAFLASERAGHITGQVVGVSGDRDAREPKAAPDSDAGAARQPDRAGGGRALIRQLDRTRWRASASWLPRSASPRRRRAHNEGRTAMDFRFNAQQSAWRDDVRASRPSAGGRGGLRRTSCPTRPAWNVPATSGG